MMQVLLLLVSAVAANHVMDHFGGEDSRRMDPFGQMMVPAFIRATNNITLIQEWTAICHSNGTIAQMEQQQVDFGTKYQLSSQVAEYQANITKWISQLESNVSAIVSALPAALSSLQKIINNKDQTVQSFAQSIFQWKNSSGQAGEALFDIVKEVVIQNIRQNSQFGGMMQMGAGPMAMGGPRMGMGGPNMGMPGLSAPAFPGAAGGPPTGFNVQMGAPMAPSFGAQPVNFQG